MVNNAGTVPNGQGIAELSDEEWDRMLDVNLRGSINVLREAWPHLARSPAGRVVNTSSSTVIGLPGALTYATSKAAILGLTKNLALATDGTAIKVNAIWPFGSSRMSSTDFAVMFEAQYGLESGQFNRTFTAEAVANGVVVLCHESTACNGEVFAIGGGRMARVFIAATRGARAMRPRASCSSGPMSSSPTPSRSPGTRSTRKRRTSRPTASTGSPFNADRTVQPVCSFHLAMAAQAMP